MTQAGLGIVAAEPPRRHTALKYQTNETYKLWTLFHKNCQLAAARNPSSLGNKGREQGAGMT